MQEKRKRREKELGEREEKEVENQNIRTEQKFQTFRQNHRTEQKCETWRLLVEAVYYCDLSFVIQYYVLKISNILFIHV